MEDTRDKVDKLSHRRERFVGNSLYSDFKFIIEDDNVEIPAHKFILASASPVLEKIVYGTETISSADFSRVDGISEKSFMEILRHIYTDKMEIDDANVFDILYKANYYDLPTLEAGCFSYLKNRLDKSSATWIFHHLFQSFSSSELFGNCIEFIQSYPKSFFDSEEFQYISVAEFKLILQQDAINCSEFDLFEAMIKLAKTWCSLNGVEATVANQREILDGAEKLLRLEATTKSEFDKFLTFHSDFFSSTEVERINGVLDKFIPTTIEKRKDFKRVPTVLEQEEESKRTLWTRRLGYNMERNGCGGCGTGTRGLDMGRDNGGCGTGTRGGRYDMGRDNGGYGGNPRRFERETSRERRRRGCVYRR